MTGRQAQDDEQRLEALYREHGDVEPDAGLDWRIRARAHREARRSGLPRPAHWLGGAAVAASLFVVVSLVTQMTPPQGEIPETAPLRSEATLEEGSASTPARQRAPSDVADRPMAPATGDAAFEPAPPPAVYSPGKPVEDTERSADTLIEEERARALERLAEDRVPLDPELGFSETGVRPEAGLDEAVQKRLWLIERFLAVGNEERARTELERFRIDYPDATVPEELLEALEARTTDGPD